MSFATDFYKNIVNLNDHDLAWALAMVAKQGGSLIDFEPVHFSSVVNVATDASFFIFPAVSKVVYFLKTVNAVRTSTAAISGTNYIEYASPFAGVNPAFIHRPYIVVTATQYQPAFIPVNILCDSAQWVDGGAAVGSFAVAINGFKITYKL